MRQEVTFDELRKRPRLKTQSLDQPLNLGNGSESEILLEIPDIESNPERLLLNDALEEYLQSALNKLPEEFRIAVIFADIEGLSYEEIAETMNCSIGTVRSRLHRGRKLLRHNIQIAQAQKAHGVYADPLKRQMNFSPGEQA